MKTNHLNNNPIKRVNKKLFFAAVLCSLMTSTAFSGTDTATVNVSATVGAVANNCTVTLGDISFGAYTGADIATTLSLGVDCGGVELPWDLLLDGGQSGDDNNRAMLGTTQGGSLSYQVYLDPSHTTAIAGGPVAALGEVPFQPAFYALLPGGQAVPNDTYSDIINVTLTF